MIIIYNKKQLIKNIIESTNNYIDKFRQDNSKDLSVKYISDFYASWIERQIILADYEVRKVLLHLLNDYSSGRLDLGSCENIDSTLLSELGEDDLEDSESLIYDINTTHNLQLKIFPQLIEDALITMVSDSWCTENQISTTEKSSLIVSELKSISLKREHNRGLKYRIIY